MGEQRQRSALMRAVHDAAEESHKAAMHMEKVQRHAGAREKVYEGEYHHSELSTDHLRDEAEELRRAGQIAVASFEAHVTRDVNVLQAHARVLQARDLDDVDQRLRSAEATLRESAQQKGHEAAEQKAQPEVSQRTEATAQQRAREAAQQKAKEEERQRAKETAKLKAEEEAKQEAETEATKKAENAQQQRARAAAQQKAEEVAKKTAERKAEAEAQRSAREAAEQKAREEEHQRAEEAAKLKAEEEAKQKAKADAIQAFPSSTATTTTTADSWPILALERVGSPTVGFLQPQTSLGLVATFFASLGAFSVMRSRRRAQVFVTQPLLG